MRLKKLIFTDLRLACMRAALFACMLAVSQVARADSGAWYFGSEYFKWSICGDGEIEFSIPVFIWDSSSNDAVTWGYIYVTPGEEEETELLYYAYDEGDNSRNMDEPVTFQAKANGEFKVINATVGTMSFTRNDGKKVWTLKRDADDDDHHTAKIRWKVPYHWRGKNIKIRVKFRYDDRYNGSDGTVKDYTLDSFACPEGAEAGITLNDPMLAMDKSSAGMIMVPWYAQAKSISDVQLRMVDAETGHVTIEEVFTDKKMAGYINIPAYRPYSSVQLSAKAVATDGMEITDRISSSSIAVSMLHIPTQFSAHMQSDGKVKLKWRVDLSEYEDIMEDDVFDIQRNLTGSTDPDDAAWTTIVQESYQRGKESYEVIDEDLIKRYIGKPVSYRIRRQSASFWGWVKDAGYAQVQIPTDINMNLFGITDATATKSSEWSDQSHKVDFKFRFSGPETDQNGCLILRSAADWEKFAQRVNSGEKKLKAIMAGDIDLGDSQTMVGTSTNPFEGDFDGNGYTLTVNYKNTSDYTAPFQYVFSRGSGNNGAKQYIRNLHVEGTIESSAKFAAGLIGYASSNDQIDDLYIENCYSSVIITSTVNGDATNGGFIANIQNTGHVYMSNCRFDGQMLGEKATDNGGFVGWCRYDNRLKFTSCLFAPTKISVYGGCKTFVRGGAATYENSYYITLFDGDEYTTIDDKQYYVIRTEDNWNTFRNLVKNAGGNSDVNAILVADIQITQPVGFVNDIPYCGTFDGNGHSLNVDIKDKSHSYMAPFSRTKNASIKNLHVAGSVTGGIHSSGLIGTTSGTNHIDNVRVSTMVTTYVNGNNGPHSGGFVGHAGSSTVYIMNCLFDGSLVSTSWNDSYAGAFIGWGSGTIVFEHNFENGTYVNYSHAGMCYHSNVAWGGNASSYSVHNWGEMASAANRNAGSVKDSVMVTRLGAQWTIDGGYVIPKMTERSIGQGIAAFKETDEELLALLGEKWNITGGVLIPAITSKGGIYGSTMWDSRAKLQLRIGMHGENGISYRYVDLTNNDDAISTQQFTEELTRNCVEYSFDMIVRRGSSTLPIIGTEADSAVYSIAKTETGDQANYRFQNSNRITSLAVNRKQSSVELVWTVSGGSYDFFRIMRREHGAGDDAWEELVTNLDQLIYEDKTVLVQQVYDYSVESIWQCEGVNVDSIQRSGECKPTGKVNGYIRMADGTAMAGVEVHCQPDTVIPGALPLYITHTDATGYYEFDSLLYQGSAIYHVTVPVKGDGGAYTAPNPDGSVTFSRNSNWTRNFNFYMDTYYVYSGNVYYRDTSIPVPGVSFKLDGTIMHDASSNVIETDNQGAFTLSIPAGKHSVQAFKKGHYFASDGFLLNPKNVEDKTQYNFDKNVSGVFLWDSTTVILRGRVVGGNVQGDLPLGKGLSRNNLGDSIRIVIQLEGDNASYLIRKQDDETVKSDSYDVGFGPGGINSSHVDVTRHSITIYPDAETGEYQLALHPAKYKVTEASALGYATLFQSGKVGETIDLSFNVKGDTCVYSRIYHSVPTVEVTQFNPGGEKYFGIKQTTATDNVGNKAVVSVFGYKKVSDTDSIPYYSFGYPVFMAGSPYGLMFQACEKYYWNNNTSKNVDIVNLDSKGKIMVKNSMTTDSKTAEWECDLDKTGGASYIFTPDNTTFVMEGTSGLKNIDITLNYDGSYYDVKPFDGEILKGYVMATMPKNNGRKGVLTGFPQLVDILRDPPGSGSSSFIEAGSKYSFGYTADLTGSFGISLSISQGQKADIYNGTVLISTLGTPGTEAGTFMESSKKHAITIDAVTYYGFNWNYSYNFDITERIQTRTGGKWIGGKADIFMGMATEILAQDAIAVRVIPKDQYDLIKTHEGGTFQATDADGNKANIKVPIGTMKVLAEGTDAAGNPVYMVRDEVMAFGPRVASTFVHSQNYIENELLPDLIKIRNSLLLPKETSLDDAKKIANKKGYPVYISQVDAGNEAYGFSYIAVDPDTGLHGDSISTLNQTIAAWIGFLVRNEQEKLSVSETNLVKRYDFDGGMASIQYTENFSAGESDSRYLRYPGINDLGQITSGIPSTIRTFVKGAQNFLRYNGKGIKNKPIQVIAEGADGKDRTVEMMAGGTYMSIAIDPVITLNFTDKSSTSETQTKKIGFTLAVGSKSSLTVDVYRTTEEYTFDKDVSTFNKFTVNTLDKLRSGMLGSNPMDYLSYNEKVFSGLVFRTRAGVTCQPYEGERATKYYQPGTVLDVATVAADVPHIWIDEPVVSNVPFDEPARYVLHFANETDYPDRATLIFNYYLLASSNPNGAKVCVDGKVISSGGENIILYPAVTNGKHNVFTKEITVYPSKEFDYEDLALCLYDPEDPARVFTQKFSAHFIPTAGKIKVSVPSDNWVVNTESPYDGRRKAWYMPVRIEGFDINYPNFDHIELQYKLSTQGDNDWVNVCSYYADPALKARASGVTDTIPASGIIVAPFYGEVDPIEQYYDIRAVTYCRYAGGYLTGSSDVLTGIKDTRLPRPFGTPEPTDGVLDPGDDIKILFSEQIAGNYLRNINNFEVLGTLSGGISTSTCLSFDDRSWVTSQSRRNLSGKSFTVDVMVNPANEAEDMAIFTHSGGGNYLTFGLTADHHLKAIINGQEAISDKTVDFANELHRVAFVLDQSGKDMVVVFFDGSLQIGRKQLTGQYKGSGDMCLGVGDDPFSSFIGTMLEFRLWNRDMTNSLDNYSNKTLTGYEGGLLDYYPLNEGEGEWGYDMAMGANDLWLIGTSWKRPDGISVEFKGDKGLLLAPDIFTLSDQQDYTLMFWYRTGGQDVTLFSNGEATDRTKEQLNIGVKDFGLYVRSAGYERRLPVFVDGVWHHFAMTVNRSRNVVNVYIDKQLEDSFVADSLSGIKGDHIALGATYKDKNTPVNVLTGNIDEVGLFSSALPVNLIKEFYNHTPMGTLSSLIAYLDFGRSVKTDNNTQQLEPTGISIKRYVDNQGKVLARRDTLVYDADLKPMVSLTSYAPMTSSAKLDNLKYGFTANNNELLIDIEEPDYMIEKTNIYVTVKDVADLRGNLMASPLMMNLYVYRNPLRWDVKRIEKDIKFGEEATFQATVTNLSGEAQSFELQDLPIWVKASQTVGVLNALDEQTITFTVSQFINVGTYNEQITLLGGNGMTENLPVNLHVHGEGPDWSVSPEMIKNNQSMMMVARINVDGMIASSPDDILGVFDERQQVLGVAHVEVDNTANANEALAFITINGYTKDDGSKPVLYFRFYNSSNGKLYNLIPQNDTVYTFQKDIILGSASDPIVLTEDWMDVQTMNLKKGWNWVSFSVIPRNSDGSNMTVKRFLGNYSTWEPGDMVKVVDGKKVQQWLYSKETNKENPDNPILRWNNENDTISIDNSLMYMIYSMSDKTVYFDGRPLYTSSITVHKNWNRIAYSSTINLPVAQAMSDYAEEASEGDIIKSQDGFAMATRTSQGIVWKGTLQFMESGKGYMLKRMAGDTVTFRYPTYLSDSRYTGNQTTTQAPFRVSTRASVFTSTTMNIVATVNGVDMTDGDVLVVYRGVERLAEAVADEEGNCYLNIGTDIESAQTLTFCIEREGRSVATTGSRIVYEGNLVLGSPDAPMVIDFGQVDVSALNDGRWYTVTGIALPDKPNQPGFYINNGKVITIK